MWRRFLCWIGFHKYEHDKRFDRSSGREICKYCPQERIVIKCMMYSDYKKLSPEIKEKYKPQFIGLPDDEEGPDAAA